MNKGAYFIVYSLHTVCDSQRYAASDIFVLKYVSSSLRSTHHIRKRVNCSNHYYLMIEKKKNLDPKFIVKQMSPFFFVFLFNCLSLSLCLAMALDIFPVLIID